MNGQTNGLMKAALALGAAAALTIGITEPAMARRAGKTTSRQSAVQTRICPVTGAVVRCPGIGPRWAGQRGAGGRGYGRVNRPGYGRRSAGGYGLRLRDGTGPNCPWR